MIQLTAGPVPGRLTCPAVTAGVVRWLLAAAVVLSACTPPVSEVDCGPLTATEPPPVLDRVSLRLMRRIDMMVRLDDAEWSPRSGRTASRARDHARAGT